MDRCPRCGWSESMTVPEAMKVLKVSDQTVRNMIKRGDLPGAIVERVPGGTRYLIPRSAVEAAAARR